MSRDAREQTPHSLHAGAIEFHQRRRLSPMVVHHPSPGGRHVHGSIYSAGPPSHPHSPAWYGSVAGSPHRVLGSSLSAVSGESLVEESLTKKREEAETAAAAAKKASDDLREKQKIIHEALKRHMDDDNSIGTTEADAASALLFATAGLGRTASSKVSVTGSKGEGQGEGQEAEAPNEKEENDNDEDTNTIQGEGKEKEEHVESSVPLKKRRKLLDFLRKRPATTTDTDKQPLHVSPLPSPQIRNRVPSHEYAAGASSVGASSSNSPPRTAGSASMSMTNSYDLKDAQCLHEGAKIKDAAEISPPPPAQVVIQHFPSLLHNVLSNPDLAGNVVQWLPDGKAWKILRWDALRRKVLPKHFSQLQDEDGKVGTSIDTFLWHVAAWGFEEVQSGPDVGAYSHEFFRKDAPQLRHQMEFSPKQGELDSPPAPKKTASTISEKLNEASQLNSILQVPSLASSASRSDTDASAKEAEHALRWREEQRKRGSIHSPAIVYPSMPGRPMRHPDAPLFVNYRMDAYGPEGWQYFPESPMAMRHLASGLTSYEQRLAQQPNFEFAGPRTLALHNIPRVQSGRGALRLPSPTKAGMPKLEQPVVVRRTSFPVSNRGKASRGGPAAVRLPVPPSETLLSNSAAKDSPDENEKVREDAAGMLKFSEEVAERVAVAISKKTKRKLPLSSNSTAVVKTEEEEKPRAVGV